MSAPSSGARSRQYPARRAASWTTESTSPSPKAIRISAVGGSRALAESIAVLKVSLSTEQRTLGHAFSRCVNPPQSVARESDDISLVGLFGTPSRPVGLRTHALFGDVGPRCAARRSWLGRTTAADAGLCLGSRRRSRRRACRHDSSATVNTLFGEDLPAPHPQHAQRYWLACQRNEIVGRCVRLGFDPTVEATPQYHWAHSTGPWRV